MFKSNKPKIGVSDALLIGFVLLLLIPTTRKPIQVALNSIKMHLFSPEMVDNEDRMTIKPFEYKVKSLEGTDSSIKVGKGKVVFIGYWATWCPPCIAEMPSIQKLFDEYGQKVDFILLTNEEPGVVARFLAKKNFDLPVYIPNMSSPAMLNSRSIPTNYIIDKNGAVIVKETGATNWYSGQIKEILDTALTD